MSEETPKRTAVVVVTIEEQVIAGSNGGYLLPMGEEVQTRIQRLDRIITDPDDFVHAVHVRITELAREARKSLEALGWEPPVIEGDSTDAAG